MHTYTYTSPPCIYLERSNQPILKEINSEYSLEGLMLKLQYSGQLMRRTDSLEKTLMLGKIDPGLNKDQSYETVARMRWPGVEVQEAQ